MYLREYFKKNFQNLPINRIIIISAVFYGIIVWIIDSLFDHLFFSDRSFWDEVLFDVENHEIYMRLFTASVAFIFGIFSTRLFFSQQKIKQELLESESKFRTVAEFTKDWDYWITPDNSIEYMSPSCLDITGFQALEFYNNPNLLETVVHPDDRAKFSIHTNEALCKADINSLEFRIITRDNKIKWLDHACQSIYYKDGTYFGHSINNRDITARKLAEEKVRESELKLQQINLELENKVKQRTAEVMGILEQSPLGKAVYDSAGKILFYNETWKNFECSEFMNITKNNLLANDCFFTAEDEEKILKIIQSGGKLRSTPRACEQCDKIIICSLYGIKDQTGKVTRIVCNLEDITELKKQEEYQRELKIQSRISEAVINLLEQERKRVAQELHDQIGQKLLVSKLGIEAIGDVDPSTEDYLENVKKQIISISKDIKSIIHSLHPAELDNYGLKEALQLMVHDFAYMSGIKSKINYFGAPVRVDKNIELSIYRIIQEATNNIAKYSEATETNIELHFDSDCIIGIIRDNGIGFNLDFVENKSPKEAGFGLISMKERARLLAGELFITSDNRGTKIHFEIPTRETEYEKD